MDITSNYTIYMHRNKINGKIYVGQTKLPVIRRWKTQGQGYKEQPYFYNAILKYGWDNFDHIILEQNLTKEQANEREEYWILAWKSNDKKHGYNVCCSGKQGNVRIENLAKVIGIKVVCYETEQIFNTLTDAAIWAGLGPNGGSNIRACLNGKRHTAGKHPETGQKLHWYEYNFPKENVKITNRVGAWNNKQVLNIETQEIYPSIKIAAENTHISANSIIKSCKSDGIRGVSGSCRKNDKKYHFKYVTNFN